MPTESKLLAVYGTLKEGWYNHPLLDNSPLIGKGYVSGTMVIPKGLGYPYFTSEVIDNDHSIDVEVYSVSNDVFRNIARLEIPHGYINKIVEVYLDSGEIEYAYIWEHPDTLKVEGRRIHAFL